MTQIKSWKSVAISALVSLSLVVIAMQPLVTFAGSGAGSHGGG